MSLYIDNNNVVELQGLKNTATGAVDEGATVTITIQDSDGNNVSGGVWPASMSHEGAGLYRATLPATLSLDYKHSYDAVVEVLGSGGQVGKWRCAVIAEIRRCD